MKTKTITLISVAVALIFFQSSSAFAQTTSSTPSSLQVLIETLKKQVAELQAKVEVQKKATSEAREAAGDVRETLSLIRELREGMSGEDVKVLQSILAADPEIYPEGKITGFFGTLTAKAVKRFQVKNGVAQVGKVGLQTLKKLNKELEKNPISEEDVPGEGKRKCAIVPPGHLIAPGWLRKNQPPIVPPCQKLPSGISTKLGTSTPPAVTSTDVTAPIISGVLATSTASSSSRILWNTNESATGKVWYGTSTPVAATGTTAMASVSSFAMNHDILLSGLSASTTYYFVAESADASGNITRAAESAFTTLAQ